MNFIKCKTHISRNLQKKEDIPTDGIMLDGFTWAYGAEIVDAKGI